MEATPIKFHQPDSITTIISDQNLKLTELTQMHILDLEYQLCLSLKKARHTMTQLNMATRGFRVWDLIGTGRIQPIASIGWPTFHFTKCLRCRLWLMTRVSTHMTLLRLLSTVSEISVIICGSVTMHFRQWVSTGPSILNPLIVAVIFSCLCCRTS